MVIWHFNYLKQTINAYYVHALNMIGVYSYCCLKQKRNSKKLPPFCNNLSFSACDVVPTFKFFEQITLENAAKVINRISCFTKILPRLYMLKKY